MSNAFKVIGILDGWKKGDLPGNQMVNIVLSHYSTLEDKNISITPQLASPGEVDEAVDYLIKELESVRKRAKAKINKDNQRIRSLLD